MLLQPYPGPRGFLLILSSLIGNLRREELHANKKIKEAVRVAKFAKKEQMKASWTRVLNPLRFYFTLSIKGC